MLSAIVKKELRLALRNGRVWPLFLAWAVLATLAALGSIKAHVYRDLKQPHEARLHLRDYLARVPRALHPNASR